MTEKEMVRLKVAERLIEGDIKVKEAADILILSTRQVIRLKERVRKYGPGAKITWQQSQKAGKCNKR